MEEKVKFMDNARFLPEVIALANEGHDVTIPLRGFSMRPFLEDGRDLAILILRSCLPDVMPFIASSV